jgi:hypothetical protein
LSEAAHNCVGGPYVPSAFLTKMVQSTRITPLDQEQNNSTILRLC